MCKHFFLLPKRSMITYNDTQSEDTVLIHFYIHFIKKMNIGNATAQ